MFCGLLYFPPPDSTTARSFTDSAGTVRRDSLSVKDTLAKKSSGIDSVVTYTATDSLVYMYKDRTMDMFGKSTVKYKTMGLDAERISIDYKISDKFTVKFFFDKIITNPFVSSQFPNANTNGGFSLKFTLS